MKEKKINLATKITILRIIFTILILIFIIVIYLLSYNNVDFFINSLIEIKLNNITISTINIYYLIIMGLFIIASLSDMLDGYIARKRNEITDVGKFLDPLADKMLIDSLLVFLSIGFNNSETCLKYHWFLVVLMIIRDLLVDALRLLAAKKNIAIGANCWGKLKTWAQIISICAILLNGFPFAYFDYKWSSFLHIDDFICYITAFISLFSGFIYYKNYFKLIKNT